MPHELASLAACQQNVSKLLLPTKTSTSSATHDYDKLMDADAPVPSAPVYAARLNGLFKTLANAEGAVTECVKARKELVAALEKVLATNRAVLLNDEAQLSQLATRKKEVENKKADIELSIMRGLGPLEKQGTPTDGGSVSPPQEPDRPEVEALTPPSMNDDEPSLSPPPQAAVPERTVSRSSSSLPPSAPGIEMLSNLASQYQALPVSTNGSNKRRRVDSNDDFPDLGGDDGIDDDVAEMLRKDSRGT
jgi:regulator of Ty1 transposition protein 103